MQVDDYLGIPEAYGFWLGGLRWSESGEVVEYAATDPEIGLTFALGAELEPFLQGVGARTGGSLLHFAHVLHFLHLLGYGSRAGAAPDRPRRDAHPALAGAYRAAGRPLRNAGVLCDALCAGLPRVPDPPRPAELARRLGEPSPMAFGLLRKYPGEEPAVGPEAFDARIRQALHRLSDDDLRHWLRHGRGPIAGAGEAIARALPTTLAQAFAGVEDRPRLQGAGALVARLAGALALPPRRLAHRELPVGGYTDVVTRGQPEQILPFQFALESEEFLRRFTARELLYFHREEPHTPTARELVLVLDQGVRTWGDVRLVLVAAAMALGRQAERRGLAVRIATTAGLGDVVDPLALSPEALGELLEASDPTPHPAAALARALAATAADGAVRDTVLLTHPRSLAEPAVTAAARGAGPDARLFAVSADGAGEVALSELRGAAAVPVARCRVDLADLHAPPPAPPGSGHPPGAARTLPWGGDVEAIGFPFRLGALAPIADFGFDFDESGEFLLAGGGLGLLHAWRVADAGGELLPRAVLGGAVLDRVDAVVGVAGGFVVAGTAGVKRALAHYDLRRRSCAVHELSVPPDGPLRLEYVRRLHTVVVQLSIQPVQAIDLAAPGPPASTRAQEAMRASRGVLEPVLLASRDEPWRTGTAVALEADTGTLAVRNEAGAWLAHVPTSEGNPTLRGSLALRAHWNGATLAVLVRHLDERRVLHLFAPGARWRGLGAHALPRDAAGFALSRDGRRAAWRQGDRQVAVHVVGAAGPPALLSPQGRNHAEVDVQLGGAFLTIDNGRYAHLVAWDGGHLRFDRNERDPDALVARLLGRDIIESPGYVEPSRPMAAMSLGDRKRFVAFAVNRAFTAAVDRFGQVALLDRQGRLIGMFFTSREEIAAWIPDGTRVGPPALLGGPPTPGGEAAIGAALWAATRDAWRDAR
jgi:hypothetical protein